MSISGMKLDLPDDIEADVGAIRSKCETLDRLCSTMMGRAHDTEGNFKDAAAHFTDAVAWDIQGATTQEIAKWEEAGGALTNGAGVLQLWADDIETYRETREELAERWENEKADAQSRVDLPLHLVVGGAGAVLADRLMDGKSKRETAEIENLQGIRDGLLSEHDTAWDLLMDRADETEKSLKEGPSPEMYERMINAGHMSWRHLGIFQPDEAPPLTEEEGEQAAEELEDYLNDPEGYEGDIGEVLAMLAVVTAAGVNNQRNGGQPPSDHMDFLEAFYEGLEDSLVNLEGPRGALGIVDYLDNNEDLEQDIAQGFLSSMGDGIMVLSDESLFGGWDRLPESIQMAASGPQLIPDDLDRGSPYNNYGPNLWGDDIAALNRLLGSASSDLHAGEGLSASLALSLGNATEAQDGVGPWIEESDALGLIEITGRNEDAMHGIFTGEFEHPFLHDENGNFKDHPAFENNDEFIDKAMTGLYSTDWSDDGAAVRNMTDWIAEQADSDDPRETRRSEQGLVALVDRISGLKNELSETGHDVEGVMGDEEVEWKNVSFGHLNPEIADSLAGVFEAHVEIFADNEIVETSGNIDGDISTGYDFDKGPMVDLGDRIDFVQLISGSPDAAARVIETADDYTMDSLSDYMGGVGEGNPDQTAATRAGLLWNAVGTGVSEEITSRIEDHNAAISDEDGEMKMHKDFARDLTATFIPNAQAAEVYKYVWNGVDSAMDGINADGAIDFPRDSMPPMELKEDAVRIHAMGAVHDHGSLDIPPPPEGTLNEDGTFNTDSNEWDVDLNSEGQIVRNEEWNNVRNQTWPGGSNTVEQVSDDFYESFEDAFELSAN